MAEKLSVLGSRLTPYLSMMPGVNVKAFGAVGTGAVDDTVALQEAFSGSGLLWIPTGTYIISRPLSVGSNTHLIAQPGAIFTRQADLSTATCGSIVYQSNGSNIIIEGLTVDGQMDSYASATRHGGIVLNNCTNAIIRDCIVTRTNNNELTAGIYLEYCWDSIIEDCYLYDNDRTAVIVRYGARNKILHCTAHDNVGSGFATTEAPDCEVADCTAYSNGYSNITINGLRNRVANNVSYLSTSVGIVLGHDGVSGGDPGHPADDSICIGNQSYNNSEDGILSVNSQHVTISNNIVYGNNRHNIYLRANTYSPARTANCVITGNNLYGTGTSGSQGCLIEYGKFHVINNNSFYNHRYSGLYIESDSGSGTVNGNIFFDNGQSGTSGSGLILAQSWGYIVTNNQFVDSQAVPTQGYGIQVAAGGSHIIGGNRFYGNKFGEVLELSSPPTMTYFGNSPTVP
jgi:parallel beta-helix repeat protein